jgi:predicted ATP-grasp superfamily ATP-dependent carboligase
MDWLLRFGEREPGHVLYPTSDDLAYLLAREDAEIRKWFLVYQPPAETILALLDKKSLLLAARRAGLESPRSWFPEDEQALEQIAREAPFPLVIKPRTQVMWHTLHKGTRVDRPENLSRAYSDYARMNHHSPVLLSERPEVARPLLQEYHFEAEEQIETVAGFIDKSGETFVARAATKVLQQPRRLGIGVCFEDAPIDPVVAESIAALCREVGYFGVFEAEFIRTRVRRLLIDFNPRYYNEMAFEIARGLPLPSLVHAAACGDGHRLRALARQAQAPTNGPGAFCNRIALATIVGAQRLSGRMGADDVRRWKAWHARHRRRTVDPAFDREDPVPGMLMTTRHLWQAVRHPRAFLRSIVLDQ